MKIYTIYLSEDGLHGSVYTNVKAIYNGISQLGYTPLVVTIMDRSNYTYTEVKYTYANLVKAIRSSSGDGKYYSRVTIDCEGGASIEIQEHEVVSK